MKMFSGRDLAGVVDGLARGQRAAAQAVAQGLALEEFGDDIRRGFSTSPADFPAANIVNRENVGMIQCCRGAGFLREAIQTVGIGGKRFRKDLDGDIAIQA